MLDLRNMDCMDLMREYPDKYFDLAIVDPPYGINISLDLHKRGEACAKNGYRKYSKKDWDNVVPDKQYFDELKRVSKEQVVWGGNYFLEHLRSTRCFIVWDKGQRDFSFADAELAWTSFNTSVRCFDYSRGKMQSESYGKFHPTAKPVKLYSWILDNYANTTDKILDTHLGSGSIAIACHYFGCDLTASEIDKEYYDAAMKRIELCTRQIKMF